MAKLNLLKLTFSWRTSVLWSFIQASAHSISDAETYDRPDFKKTGKTIK